MAKNGIPVVATKKQIRVAKRAMNKAWDAIEEARLASWSLIFSKDEVRLKDVHSKRAFQFDQKLRTIVMEVQEYLNELDR